MYDLEQRFYSEVREDKQEPLSNSFEVTHCHCRNRKKIINSNILLCTNQMKINSEVNRDTHIAMKTTISPK